MLLQSLRALAIQSKVVHGYCGNNCAVFALQRLGFEVDSINTVQFSNHPGYTYFGGPRLNADEFTNISKALSDNGIMKKYTHVLTGYIGTKALLKSVGEVVSEIKRQTGSVIYLCDPVLGDNGSFYVDESCCDIYKVDIIPYADIITPNHFEAEVLSGIKIVDIDSAMDACQVLHKLGPSTVIISGISRIDDTLNTITLVGSSAVTEKAINFKISIPKIDGYFTGTGDLFSALLLVSLQKYPTDVKKAVEIVVSRIYSIILFTHNATKECSKNNDAVLLPADRELKLIQFQDKLIIEEVYFKAEEIS